MVEKSALAARLLHHLGVVAGAGDAESLGIDGAKHIEVDETVVQRRNQGIGHRMNVPRQNAVMTGGIDHNKGMALRQRTDGIGERLAIVIIGSIETQMFGNFEVAANVLSPG